MTVLGRDSLQRLSLEMCDAVYRNHSIAGTWRGSGVVATQAQRYKGREWSWYMVGERSGKSSLP